MPNKRLRLGHRTQQVISGPFLSLISINRYLHINAESEGEGQKVCLVWVVLISHVWAGFGCNSSFREQKRRNVLAEMKSRNKLAISCRHLVAKVAKRTAEEVLARITVIPFQICVGSHRSSGTLSWEWDSLISYHSAVWQGEPLSTSGKWEIFLQLWRKM